MPFVLAKLFPLPMYINFVSSLQIAAQFVVSPWRGWGETEAVAGIVDLQAQ